MKDKICECCGAKVVEYKHVLNIGLLDALHELSKHKYPIPLTDLNITRNQWTNFQKLRYWGLVAREVHADGTGTGNWYVTSGGRSFIHNQIPMSRNVWTFRGETVRLGDDCVYFSDVFDSTYKQRIDYAREAMAHA